MKKNYYYIVSIICTIICIIAKILSPGWMVILGFIPMIGHFLFFIVFVHDMIKYRYEDKNINKYFILSCISLLLAYIFLPDFMDAPKSGVAVFGLIKESEIQPLMGVCGAISAISFAVNIYIMYKQYDNNYKAKMVKNG